MKLSPIAFFLIFSVLACGDDDAAAGDAGPGSDSAAPMTDAASATDATAPSIDAGLPAPCEAVGTEFETLHAIDGFGFVNRVDVALDAERRLHLVANVGTAGDGTGTPAIRYLREDDAGTFVQTDVVAPSDVANQFPVLALGSDGTAHIVWQRFVVGTGDEGQLDLFYASVEPSGAASAPINLTNTDDVGELGAAVLLDSEGTLHVIYAERTRTDPDVDRFSYRTGYLTRDSGGSVSAPELFDDVGIVFAGQPENALALGSDGTLHAVYLTSGTEPSDGVATYRSRASGASAFGAPQTLSDAGEDARGVSIAVAPDNGVHVTYAIGFPSPMAYHLVLGASPTAVTDGSLPAFTYYRGLAWDQQGVGHLALLQREGTNRNVYYLRAETGTFTPPVALTSTDDADENPVSAVAAGRCGEVAVAYVENFAGLEGGQFNGDAFVAVRR